jgi:anti-sigma factor RsiW
MFSTIFQPVLTELSKAPPETAAIVGMTTVSLFALWVAIGVARMALEASRRKEDRSNGE